MTRINTSIAALRLGKNITLLREAHNMNQSELARRTDLSRSYIYGVEKGDFSPNIFVVQRIAEVFHCPIEELLSGVNFRQQYLEKEIKRLQVELETLTAEGKDKELRNE